MTLEQPHCCYLCVQTTRCRKAAIMLSSALLARTCAGAGCYRALLQWQLAHTAMKGQAGHQASISALNTRWNTHMSKISQQHISSSHSMSVRMIRSWHRREHHKQLAAAVSGWCRERLRSQCELNHQQNTSIEFNRGLRLATLHARILRVPVHRQREVLLIWAYRSAAAMEQRVQVSSIAVSCSSITRGGCCRVLLWSTMCGR